MGTGTHWDWRGLGLKRWLAVPRAHRRPRRLRLVESLALGEKRFVGVLSVDGRELLIGATPHSLTILTDLGDPELDGAFLSSTPEDRELQ